MRLHLAKEDCVAHVLSDLGVDVAEHGHALGGGRPVPPTARSAA